jgi:hypothetical protein
LTDLIRFYFIDEWADMGYVDIKLVDLENIGIYLDLKILSVIIWRTLKLC